LAPEKRAVVKEFELLGYIKGKGFLVRLKNYEPLKVVSAAWSLLRKHSAE
jgi:hypothetical protein